MSKKLGGKKLLIITTCVSVIAAVSLFRDEPQNLLAGTKTALYNGQNVVYDSQKAGGSQVAYKTYCTDSNCTFQYAGEGSDKKIAVINMDKESTVMSELAEIVDADLIDMPDDVSNINISQYNTLFVNPTSDDYRVSDDIKEFAGKANLDGKTIVVIYDVTQDIIILINVAHQMIILCFMMISRKKALCYVINHNVGMMEKSAWHIFQEVSLKVSCITIIRTYI